METFIITALLTVLSLIVLFIYLVIGLCATAVLYGWADELHLEGSFILGYTIMDRVVDAWEDTPQLKKNLLSDNYYDTAEQRESARQRFIVLVGYRRKYTVPAVFIALFWPVVWLANAFRLIFATVQEMMGRSYDTKRIINEVPMPQDRI